MLTSTQVTYLLSLDKRVFENSTYLTDYGINGAAPIRQRIILKSEQDDEWIFLWSIDQSSKNLLKLSLHLQENQSYTGLIRVDFNGIHENPGKVKPGLPADLIPYVGHRFEYSTPHIHIFVDGYKPLAWARPLNVQQFSVSDIITQEDACKAIEAFARIINLSTNLNISRTLL